MPGSSVEQTCQRISIEWECCRPELERHLQARGQFFGGAMELLCHPPDDHMRPLRFCLGKQQRKLMFAGATAVIVPAKRRLARAKESAN